MLVEDQTQTAAAFEELFERNHWPPQWRAGIYAYHHYHSTAHEVLGVASGSAQIMLGGPHGKDVRLEAGDALMLPAGIGHCQLCASDDFSVVGAYPRGQDFDVCREAPNPDTLLKIEALGAPANDPVAGEDDFR